jgi:hypothetical protein
MHTPRALALLATLAALVLPSLSAAPRETGKPTAQRVEKVREDAGSPVPLSRFSARSGREERTFGTYREIDGQNYAVLDETWTFDHGHDDPAEGWEVRDLTAGFAGRAWRRIVDNTDEWNTRNPLHGGPAPTINGHGSAWVGMYEDSAAVLCWAGGLGYGNYWCQDFASPELTYDGSGNVAISFDYWCDLENGIDFVRVYLKTFPSGTQTLLATFTGVDVTQTHAGSITQAQFGGETAFRLVFRLTSDVSWSDEDGDYDTADGPFAFDDLSLTGNLVGGDRDWDFEAGQGGFTASSCSAGGFGAFLQVNTVGYYEANPDLISLNPSPADCPDLQGNVLAFHHDDLAHEHPQGKHIIALTPIVDLTGITGIEQLRADYDDYIYVPYADGVMYRPGWVYYPYTNPCTGEDDWSPRVGLGFWFYSNIAGCTPGSADATTYVPAGAEKVRFLIEIMADCEAFSVPVCSDTANPTPLFDNVAVVINGTSLQIPGFGACCIENGACEYVLQSVCDTYGGTWHDGVTCSPVAPCVVPTEPVAMAAGLINPEPWNDWISDYGEPIGIPLQAEIPDHAGEIEHVEFYYSTDGGLNWEFIADDTTGYEPTLDTSDTTVVMLGCGWSTDLVLPDTTVSGPIQIKTVAYPAARDSIQSVVQYMYDPAPPSMGRVNVDDFVLIDQDALGIELSVDPGGEIIRIIVRLEPMQQEFVKGIPGISQQAHSPSHCAPTAAAQCLKYFEGAGDDSVAGGLDDYHLTGALAAYMSTNQTVSGTLPSNWVGGMTEWLEAFAPDYTVRYFVHYVCENGCSNWTEEQDWTRIRNELEMCHDVLVGVFWDGGGGHAITLNSILHPPLSDGTYLVGYKDPWTGASESGHLDPATGHFSQMTGAGGGGGGNIGVTMIVTPAEGAIDEGPGDLIYDGLPLGGPPYALEIPIPEEGYWFVHITVVNPEGHAEEITRIVEYNEDAAGADDGRPPLLATYLRPCRPNPFHERTEVAFAVPRSTHVEITIHDVTGRLIKRMVDGVVDPGIHKVAWDGRDNRDRPASSGIYYVSMRTPEHELSRSVMLLR